MNGVNDLYANQPVHWDVINVTNRFWVGKFRFKDCSDNGNITRLTIVPQSAYSSTNGIVRFIVLNIVPSTSRRVRILPTDANLGPSRYILDYISQHCLSSPIVIDCHSNQSNLGTVLNSPPYNPPPRSLFSAK